MLNLVQILNHLGRDRRGISAVEYGVLGAIVIVTVFGGAGILAGGITNVFGDIVVYFG